MKTTERTPNDPPPDRVPLFGTWRAAYLTVIAVFAVEVALFYALTHYFA